MGKIKLDGQEFEVRPKKENDDPSIPNIMPHYNSETSITNPTELGEVIKDMDTDTIEPGTRMSSIDTRTRLNYMNITAIWSVDALVGMRCLPTSCLAFTRQMKRLLVSMDGKGREERVRIIVGDRDQKAKSGGMFSGMMDKGKSFFGGGNNGA